MRVLFVATVASVMLSVPAFAQQPADATQSSNAARYDEFMQLSNKQRQEQFSRLDSDSRAFLVRTHAERWLAANKGQLSRSDFSVFQEALTFITSQLYDSPTTLDVFKRTSDIKGRIRCRVSQTDAAEAFSVFSTMPLPYSRVDARWSYLKQAGCWMAWHAESVIDYIPTFPI
jgi:hypothetical protein